MKRFIILLCVVAFVVALPLSHVAAKGKAPAKVEICHVKATADLWGSPKAFGIVIEVSANAIPAHEAHGDSIAFNDLPENQRDMIEGWTGVNLKNSDCWFPIE